MGLGAGQCGFAGRDSALSPSITTTHLLQDTGCMAIPFVDVPPQTIAATLAVRSIPEAETQAVVVILVRDDTVGTYAACSSLGFPQRALAVHSHTYAAQI